MAATAYTAKVTLTYSDGSPSVSGSVTQTADAIDDRIVSLVAGETDKHIDMDVVYTKIKELFMVATQDMTVETNAADHTAGDIISLKATVPYWWSSASGVANPLAFNITSLYLTNSSGTLPCQFQVNVLYDAAL